MLYHSLTDRTLTRSFAEAVVEGLAPDKGLYYPERIPSLPEGFWLSEEDLNPWDLGAAMMSPWPKVRCLTRSSVPCSRRC